MARVIVIGAGIAGMAAAIGLRRLYLETLIIEQASELGEVGSGISLWPNALKALASLGIDGPGPATRHRRRRRWHTLVARQAAVSTRPTRATA